MFMDKSVLDETHPQYIGMYDGRLMTEAIRAFVAGCDCVLGIGAMLTEFNSGAFTARIGRHKSSRSADAHLGSHDVYLCRSVEYLSMIRS